jgi:hypothetical protein
MTLKRDSPLANQRVDSGPYLGYPEMPIGPKNMLRQEKVKISYLVRHSGRIPALFQALTRFDITHVQVGIDAIFLQILKALSMD